ncbi:MAG TPA: UbiX family flavin prenyltransferase [Ramlibacter sp.]|uniref:UbiX family flavin prenyltransferase n=1 Tax=Ramlibacter sp. TaxID=1917967 RepID=UPI002C738B94|nr:UbiX family flavin prenyltransferase [Ramlibacter sp.]HVZ46428.1 UbiX family flavin prenyltransferase [Ramlibacter sp.]
MEQATRPRRLAVGITGATGAIYGEKLLRALMDVGDVQVHLMVSPSGWRTIAQELQTSDRELRAMVDVVHDSGNIGAAIASGAYACDAMMIAPCSMRTLGAVANGLADNLITRTADVMLKERRPLLVLTTEAPLHLAHLRNMTAVTQMGAIACPATPAFHVKPKSIGEIVNHTVAHMLDLIGIQKAAVEET